MKEEIERLKRALDLTSAAVAELLKDKQRMDFLEARSETYFRSMGSLYTCKRGEIDEAIAERKFHQC